MDLPETIDKIVEWLITSTELIATKGFELAYRQAIGDAFVYLFWSVAGLAFFIWMVVVLRNHIKEERFDEGSFFLACVAVVSFLVFAFDAVASIRRFINPAWYAIEKIFYLIQKTPG